MARKATRMGKGSAANEIFGSSNPIPDPIPMQVPSQAKWQWHLNANDHEA